MPRRKKPESTLSQQLDTAISQFVHLGENEPVRYLELRRLEYVKRLEGIADEAARMAVASPANFKGAKELELKALAFLTRLTSIWKTRVDVSASHLGLMQPPKLAGLSDEELVEIETTATIKADPEKMN